ncbi:hypothetical protein [Variovorax sp. DAIF25]|uniref:hypothetical protein n=1 Tax=Variovorax sp. DAIF25 TaxID=3080983 RepID=UPI003D6BF863
MSYDIEEHRHRFAVWTAGRAYARGGTGGGYSMANAKWLIETSQLRMFGTLSKLPEPEAIDAFVHERIAALIDVSRSMTYSKAAQKDESLPFVCTYGRAQKLVNIYLKTTIVCSQAHDDPAVSALHPPLDRVLLEALTALPGKEPSSVSTEFAKAIRAAKRQHGVRWTSFDKSAYVTYIDAIKLLQKGQPLWAVEEHWRPERIQDPSA